MRVAAVAGLLFYVGMLTVHTPALLLALQLLNAIYIGIWPVSACSTSGI